MSASFQSLYLDAILFCIVSNIYSKEGPARVGKLITLLYSHPHSLNLLVDSMLNHRKIITSSLIRGKETKVGWKKQSPRNGTRAVLPVIRTYACNRYMAQTRLPLLISTYYYALQTTVYLLQLFQVTRARDDKNTEIL